MSHRKLGALFYLMAGVALGALAFTADTNALRVLTGVGAVLFAALALVNWKAAPEE